MFANLSGYTGFDFITESSPEKLSEAIRSIRRPIKIISIVADKGEYTVFFTSDIPIKKRTKK